MCSGKVRLPGHRCVFNKYACGAVKLKKAMKHGGGMVHLRRTPDRKAGAAFTAIGITEVQADVSEEIATDRSCIK